MALDIIGEISFGYSFNSQKTELNPFLAATVRNAEGAMPLTSRLILRFLPFMWYLPFGPAKVLKEMTKISAGVLDEVQVLLYNLFVFFFFFFTLLICSNTSGLWRVFIQPLRNTTLRTYERILWMYIVKYIINFESVFLSPKHFFRLCLH